MPGRIDEKDILFGTFAEITSLISLGRDNRVIFNKILNIALDLLPARKIYLIYVDDHRIVKYSGEKQERGRKISVEDLPESNGILNWLNREVNVPMAGDSVFAIDLSTLASECLQGDDRSTMVISAPLMARNSLLGVILAIQDEESQQFNEDDIHLLTMMANQAAIAFENYLLYRKLEMESITDGLTGVYNYRFLIRSLRLEVKRAKRFNSNFSFLMLDVDNLKEYNDGNGHLSGSRALTDIAAILSESSREIDIVAKYGGDEFGILLPGTTGDGAIVYGERVLDGVRNYMFDGQTKGLLTCSIGISVYPDDAANVEKIIDRADTALYKAKSDGKDSIRTYSSLEFAGRT
jgi:diguanylate cyclase (GGDEF)-like protein